MSGNFKILVADDEPNIVRLLQVNLEREGYLVSIAADGREALAAIRSFEPDLVVCDVMMPKMDGLSVLKVVRRDEDTVDLPFIMLSAKAQEEDLERGYRAGADLYLVKPFNPAELIGFIKLMLNNRTRHKPGQTILSY